MDEIKHKVFISFYHEDDQCYKNELASFAEENGIFIDCSVATGDIDENLEDEKIRENIRDEYLKDTSVTILLVGQNTRYRKHVDWELYSSMYDGKKNKKSGILVINLPSIDCKYYRLCSPEEKSAILPNKKWITINSRAEYERRYPYMPDRIIDNLMKSGVNISIVNWDDLNADNLRLLVNKAYESRKTNNYDMSRPMRKRNS